MYPASHSRRPLLAQFARNRRDRIVEAGMISRGEFTDWVEAISRHLDDAGTTVISNVFVQARGVKA